MYSVYVAGFHPGQIRISSARFWGGRKTGKLAEKLSEQGEYQQQTEPTWHRAGIKPRPHKLKVHSLHRAIPAPQLPLATKITLS